MAASAMPVLPDDGSRMVWPGASRPSFSARSIMARAMRSFTEPNGFWLSSLARMRTSALGESRLTSTSGVLPMRSSTSPAGSGMPGPFSQKPIGLVGNLLAQIDDQRLEAPDDEGGL